MMTNNSTSTKFQEKKENIYSALNGIFIKDPKITDALHAIPRDIFTNPVYQNSDSLYLLEGNRAVLPTNLVASILNLVNIKPDGSALVLGCGNGYLACILSKLYSNVFAVEPLDPLAEIANKNFQSLEIDNVILFDSFTSKNIAQQGPYDLIYFEGGTEKIPPLFFDQLANEGQLITYIPTNEKIGNITCYTKKESFWEKKTVLECWLPTFDEFKLNNKFIL